MPGDLSTYFFKSELKCPCLKCKHKKVRVSSLLLFKLEEMIIIIDEGLDFHRPVIVLSGNRCIEYNREIGGYNDSAHVPNPDGEGADIKVIGIKPIDLGLIAEKVGGLRIGIAEWGIHTDIRKPCPSKFWIYESSVIYSGRIQNESLLEFYNIVKRG